MQGKKTRKWTRSWSLSTSRAWTAPCRGGTGATAGLGSVRYWVHFQNNLAFTSLTQGATGFKNPSRLMWFGLKDKLIAGTCLLFLYTVVAIQVLVNDWCFSLFWEVRRHALMLQSSQDWLGNKVTNILNQGVAEEYISRQENHLHCC